VAAGAAASVAGAAASSSTGAGVGAPVHAMTTSNRVRMVKKSHKFLLNILSSSFGTSKTHRKLSE
jgi:hypothetical protein